MRFLVVDDSMTMRRIFVNTLRLIGHSDIIEAEDGEAALGKLAKNRVDFIITDWNMPVMNGLEFIIAVRRKPLDVPILVVSSNTSEEDVVEAIQAGASNYMVKPFSPATLKRKISMMVAS